MFNLRKLLLVSVLSILPIAAIKGDCNFFDHNHNFHNCDDNDSHFTLADLEGTYIFQGFTAGGPGPQSSATVATLEITDKHGNGRIPYLTVRTFTGTLPSTTFQLPSPEHRKPLPVKVRLKRDGTGVLRVQGFPTKEDTTLFDIVLKKRNGKVVKGFFVKTGVRGPNADTAAANEIKIFQLERQ